MSAALLQWSLMYENKSPWMSEDVKWLNLPASIASELARLVTMEAEVLVSESHVADELNEALEHFIKQMPNYVEFAAATGGMVFKPYLTETGIAVDVVRSGQFYPVNFDSSGRITAIIFPEYKQVGKKTYIRLEYQSYENDKYTIINKAYVSNKMGVTNTDITNLGLEINLKDVPEWEQIEPLVELFNAKETAIQASDEFFKKDRSGNLLLPKGKERTFRPMGSMVTDTNGRPFFNVYSPEIRDESFFNGCNRIIQKFCELGSVTGLCGVNCYHSYNPFVRGISVRTYTDEELAEMNAKELEKHEYGGKEFNAYEATQEQRKMELQMRKTRGGGSRPS